MSTEPRCFPHTTAPMSPLVKAKAPDLPPGAPCSTHWLARYGQAQTLPGARRCWKSTG